MCMRVVLSFEAFVLVELRVRPQGWEGLIKGAGASPSVTPVSFYDEDPFWASLAFSFHARSEDSRLEAPPAEV